MCVRDTLFLFKVDKRTQRPKIWMYKDKASGRMKGECTVTFDDPYTAKSAISWFDGKLFMGRTVKVMLLAICPRFR